MMAVTAIHQRLAKAVARVGAMVEEGKLKTSKQKKGAESRGEGAGGSWESGESLL